MRRILFLLFFISGFSGLVYQVVWTRLAFASFGIIMPVLSVVISVFMLGLSLGAWAAGRLVGGWQRKAKRSAIWLYAGSEFVIGLGAFAVPELFKAGAQLLLQAGQSDSTTYLFLSAVVLAASVFPWCLCMGATLPLMMAFVREREPKNRGSFSFLYLANVLGAMAGTLLSAVLLIELFGFHRTLAIAAAGNWIIAFASMLIAWRQPRALLSTPEASERLAETQITARNPAAKNTGLRWILFSTGFCSMAMEVVWARAFTPVLRTQVYSFAAIVFCYLAATSVGSWWYRRDLRKGGVFTMAELISLLCVGALLPVLMNDFRILPKDWRGSLDLLSAAMLLASIGPLCAALGYLTPSLIDQYSRGDPGHAGKAYALNVLGCILGPLFAGYVLLPWLSERYALVLLSLPFFVIWLVESRALTQRVRWVWGLAAGVTLVCALFLPEDFEARMARGATRMEVRRDHAAFVVSAVEGQTRELLVNGVGMTALLPVTKYMVHLPLVLQKEKPESVLIICFGMGTTHRSALSWDVKTTSVELVPSVRDAFGFYHADAKEKLCHPKGRIVIDDGRRFLNRSSEQFDAIVIDPPPPLVAAGSSLLYSVEFYELAKQHLKPNGILQTWVPHPEVWRSPPVFRSVCDAFPYVRCFLGLEARGYHILASMKPIELPPETELLARIPPAAKRDLLEWSASQNLSADFQNVFAHEIPLTRLLSPNHNVRITDDRPYNEYFFLRENVFHGR